MQTHCTPEELRAELRQCCDSPSLQFKEYLSRAEYIKSVIDGQVPAVQAQNGTGQKARGPGGGGGGNDKDAVSLLVLPLLGAPVRARHPARTNQGRLLMCGSSGRSGSMAAFANGRTLRRRSSGAH